MTNIEAEDELERNMQGKNDINLGWWLRVCPLPPENSNQSKKKKNEKKKSKNAYALKISKTLI